MIDPMNSTSSAAEENTPSPCRRRRWSWVDAVLIVLAITMALPSLSYPLFRDQAHHYYVGRWWIEGLQPYRDSFDLKPPFIFGLHAIGHALFGIQQWWIRLLDMISVIGITLLTALAAPRRNTPFPGEIGSIVLLGVLMYLSLFDFVCSAQCESFEGFYLFLGWLAVSKLQDLRKAAFLSGACAATAIGFKTPGLVPALGIVILLLWRTWKDKASRRRIAVAAAWHVLGIMAIALPTLAWFFVHGALPELYDTLINYTLHYAHEKQMTSAYQWWRVHYFFVTRAGAWAWISFILAGAAIALSLKHRDSRAIRCATSAGFMFGLCVLSVVLQGRFFAYHWVILFPFTMVLIAMAPSQLCMAHRWAGHITLPILCSLALVFPGDRSYLAYIHHWLQYAGGSISRSAFLNTFRSNWNFNARDSEILAARIRDIARPGDYLASLTREPNINVLADLPAPTLHPAWYPPMNSYRNGKWLEERNTILRNRQCRFILAPTRERLLIRSLEEHGYDSILVVNAMTILERSPAPRTSMGIDAILRDD